jgi:hypothetical protein
MATQTCVRFSYFRSFILPFSLAILKLLSPFLSLFPFFIPSPFSVFILLSFSFVTCFPATFHSLHPCFHPLLSGYRTIVLQYGTITSCTAIGAAINFRLTGSLLILASRHGISTHGKYIRSENGNTENKAEYNF